MFYTGERPYKAKLCFSKGISASRLPRKVRAPSGVIHGPRRSTPRFTGPCVCPNGSCCQSIGGPKIVTKPAREPASNQELIWKRGSQANCGEKRRFRSRLQTQLCRI